MNKARRQDSILRLIRSRPVHTQQDLVRALKTQRIPATQVTLSRDIRDLGLVKTPQGYAQVDAETASQLARPDVAAIAREILLDVKQARNLLVLRTPPANANTLAAAIDHAGWPQVTGTIAGDDTVLIVAPDTKTAEALRTKFARFLSAV